MPVSFVFQYFDLSPNNVSGYALLELTEACCFVLNSVKRASVYDVNIRNFVF